MAVLLMFAMLQPYLFSDVKYLYIGMPVEAWFETQLNNNIYELTNMRWKYYSEMKES